MFWTVSIFKNAFCSCALRQRATMRDATEGARCKTWSKYNGRIRKSNHGKIGDDKFSYPVHPKSKHPFDQNIIGNLGGWQRKPTRWERGELITELLSRFYSRVCKNVRHLLTTMGLYVFLGLKNRQDLKPIIKKNLCIHRSVN